ncbi:MAG: glycosyltransferase family 1 protein, partial [Desulfovibrio sp.]|nr:glycosyltransferase family 1 protein [Desulfovibrio sp.]
MQKILWTGNHFFVASLAQAGWTKVFHHRYDNFAFFSYEDLVKLAGFEPDVLLVADKSMPPNILGVEEFPCLTVLYVVDSHLHSWYPYYAQAFDFCLVSLKDHLPLFSQAHLSHERVMWLPPFAQDHYRPDPDCPREICYDCLFVGRVSALTPKRQIFLKELSELFPSLEVTTGSFANLFPKAKVVLNFCEHGDLNFRVFEALGMGSALVTPRIGNGQDGLFRN